MEEIVKKLSMFVGIVALLLAGCGDGELTLSADDLESGDPLAESVDSVDEGTQFEAQTSALRSFARSGRYRPSSKARGAGNAQAGSFGYWYANRCIGYAHAGTKRLGNWLVNKFPATHSQEYSCRGVRGSNSVSVHSDGRAIDLFIPTVNGAANNGWGDRVANYLASHAGDIGVQFFIWDRTTYLTKTGKFAYYSGSHPHHDHLHIELTPYAARNLRNSWLPNPGRTTTPPTNNTRKAYNATINVKTFSLGHGHNRGNSKGVKDAQVGKYFVTRIYVKNTGRKVLRDVRVRYAIGSPYVRPYNYHIYSDYPAKNQRSWTINSADSNRRNPSRRGWVDPRDTFHLDAFSPGETKVVTIWMKATRRSIGKVNHVNLLAWVKHIPNVYGEARRWNSKPTNANKIGKRLRDYEHVDVW
jgi:hypothetical protein